MRRMTLTYGAFGVISRDEDYYAFFAGGSNGFKTLLNYGTVHNFLLQPAGHSGSPDSISVYSPVPVSSQGAITTKFPNSKQLPKLLHLRDESSGASRRARCLNFLRQASYCLGSP